MNFKLKSLLVWLMLLALPLQGFASATMLSCAPELPAMHAHAVHHSTDNPTVLAAHGGEHTALSALPAAHDEHDAQAHHHGKCHTCSTCCSSASITHSSALFMAPDAPAFRSIPFVGRPMPSAVLALPERPPRA